jgi:hypothetical protein
VINWLRRLFTVAWVPKDGMPSNEDEHELDMANFGYMERDRFSYQWNTKPRQDNGMVKAGKEA